MSATETPKNPSDALASLRISGRDDPQPPSLAGRLFKWLLILCVLIGGIGGGIYFAKQQGYLSASAEWVPEGIRSKPEVRVAKVTVEKGRAANAVVVATGYLESRRQAMIGARAAGRIDVVNVEEGSKVTNGEILAVLEHRDVDAALAAAKATLARANAELAELEVDIERTGNDFKRAEKLWKGKSISEGDYDAARFAHDGAVAKRASLKASIALAEARVEETEQLRENMIIRAPFNGTVISKDAEVGESILPGGMGEASGRGSVVTIADLEHLEVDCDVKEDYINRVRQEAPVEVAVDAVPDVRYKGRVRKIIPMGDRARATIKVKVEILNADGRLFPDMSATVYFLPQEDEKTTTSEATRRFADSKAVQSSGSESFVWTLDAENRVTRTVISAGPERDGRTEILSGLSGGERIVISPPDTLRSGMSVKIRE